MKGGLLLRRIRVDPTRGAERSKNLPFLLRGLVEIELRSPLTLLIGENGSGKTRLLEAVAANCAIRPGGGRSYAETEDEREDTALSAAVDMTFGGRRPKGLFLRADRLPKPWRGPEGCRCRPPANGAFWMSRATAKACSPC